MVERQKKLPVIGIDTKKCISFWIKYMYIVAAGELVIAFSAEC